VTDDDDDDDLKFNLPFSTLYYPVESNFNDFTALCFHVIDVPLTVRSDFIVSDFCLTNLSFLTRFVCRFLLVQ
jgi:hypothetical protein